MRFLIKLRITGDESCVHHNHLKSKLASMQWKHPSPPPSAKYRVTVSACKVMLTIFWDFKGVILAEIIKKGEIINAQSYCEVLFKISTFCRKRPLLQEL